MWRTVTTNGGGGVLNKGGEEEEEDTEEDDDNDPFLFPRIFVLKVFRRLIVVFVVLLLSHILSTPLPPFVVVLHIFPLVELLVC